MKVRMDFVTNSSSSSFILARTSKLNEKQKAAILKYVEENMLGEPILTPESTEEDILKAFEDNWYFDYYEDSQEKVREELKNGKSIYMGEVHFDGCGIDYGDVLQAIWKLLEEHGDGNFVAINDDLSY